MKTVFPLLLLFCLTCESHSQTMMTRAQVYDFSINDEFQYHHASVPPNADRIKIIGKYYSVLNDTVFYIRHLDNYSSQFVSIPSPHLDYTFSTYTDTIFITDLDTLINAQANNWLIIDSAEDFYHDSLYYSTPWCGRLIYEYTGKSDFYNEHAQFGQGLGTVEYFWWGTIYPFASDDYIMIYFKKDTIECGESDTTDSASVDEIYELERISSTISLYPNPADNILTIVCAFRQKLNLSIFNMVGELVFQRELDYSQNEVDISTLTSGIYIIKVTCADWSVQRKLIKE